jgi:hypothetical protein
VQQGGPAAWLAKQARWPAPDSTPRGLMLPTHLWVERPPTAAAGERAVQESMRPAMLQTRQPTTQPWISPRMAPRPTRRPDQTQARLCAPPPMASARDAPARCKARVTTPRGGAVVCPARPTEDSQVKAAAIGTAVSGLTFLWAVPPGRLPCKPPAAPMDSPATTTNVVAAPLSERA